MPFTLPQRFLQVYYTDMKDELGIDYDTFMTMAQDKDADDIEAMVDYLYDNHYKGMITRDRFEKEAMLPGWRDEQPSWWQVIGANVAERASDLVAGGMTSLAGAAEWANRNIDIGVSDQIKAEGGKDALTKALRSGADKLRDMDFKYGDEEITTWDEFKESPARKFIPFALEKGIISLPDMGAAVINLPAYVLARTGEIGTERAENDLRDEATVEDLLSAAPAAAASSALERLGAAKVFGLGKTEGVETAGEFAGEVARRIGTESATEAVQEPVEQIGAAARTQAWAGKTSEDIASELLEASAQGAVVGAGFGGAVGTTTLATQQIMDRKRQVQPDQVAETETQAAQDIATDIQATEPDLQQTEPPVQDIGADIQADEQAVQDAATAMADDERSIDSMVMEEEAKKGIRRRLNVGDLASGDRVVVDTQRGQSEIGTVESVSPRLVRVMGDDGAPVAVIRPNKPAVTDPVLYSMSEADIEASAPDAAQTETENATREMGRLIKRSIENPEDENAIRQLTKIRNSEQFQNLSEDARNKVDDHFAWLQQQEAQRKEAEDKARSEEKEDTTSTPETEDIPTPDNVRAFNAGDLETDAEAFQYKSGGDTQGVTDRLQGVKKWDPAKAGMAIVYERKDGSQVVADGHQRLGLAKRIEEEYGDPVQMMGVLYREDDGYTEKDVRAIAAAKNIAEGSGDAFDAAQILRDRPQEDLDTLPPNSRLVRNAKQIARMEDDAFAAAKASDISAVNAAVIGRMAKGDGPLQEALVREFAENPPSNEVEAETMVQLFAENRGANETTEDMFGEIEVAQSYFREKAKITSALSTRLKNNKRVFQTLVENAEKIEAAGNQLGGENEQIAGRAGMANAYLRQMVSMKGPVADSLDEAAKAYAEGESLANATKTVQAALEQEIQGDGPNRDPSGQIRETTETQDGTSQPQEEIAQADFFGEQPPVEAAPEPETASVVEPEADMAQVQPIKTEKTKPKTTVKKFGAENTVYTQDRFEAARERMRQRFNTQLNAGVDPELIRDGIEMAGFYIEGGVRKFSDYSAKMIEDLGEGVQPYLRSFYEAVRVYPGIETTDLSTPEEIESFLADVAGNQTTQQEEPAAAEGENDLLRKPEAAAEPEPEPALAPDATADADLIMDERGAPFPRKTAAVTRMQIAGITGDAVEVEGGWAIKPDPGAPTAESPLNERIAYELKQGTKIGNLKLFGMAEEAFGGTVGEGKFTAQDAYNEAELAINTVMAERPVSPDMTLDEAKEYAAEIEAMTANMPTQTRRSDVKDDFQQFSTPPPYAFAVTRAANLKAGDQVLEPSAGNGGLAVFARATGANVDVNEIDSNRSDSLKSLGFRTITNEDGEQIANILDAESYDAVIMNPPFSAAGQRGVKGTSAIGGRHVMQAVEMLRPGGRLVAIMGEGFRSTNKATKGVFQKMGREGQFRAVVNVDGSKIYRKYGTTFDNRVLVYDKTGQPNDPSQTITGDVSTIPELLDMLEGVRDETGSLAADGDRQTVSPTAERTEQPDASRDDMAGGVAGQTGKRSDTGQRQRDGRLPVSDVGAVEGQVRRSPDLDAVAGSVSQRRNETDTGRSGPTSGRNRQPVRDSVETETVTDQTVKEEKGTAFSTYVPSRAKIKGSKPHPANLVESTAMATVQPPVPTYRPAIDKKTIESGNLSDAQLEAITFAGEAHSKTLNNGKRKGFLIGDGTGVGKGREIAGIIKDNVAQGRKKAIWISQKSDLLKDAIRDSKGVGLSVPVIDATTTARMSKLKGDGVAFASYNIIKQKPRNAKPGQLVADGIEFPNVKKIVDWVGKDFDGVIAFDESHVMKNASPVQRGAYKKKASNVAKAGLELARVLPNARVVYVSATGATEPENLPYLERLGLWGERTAFANGKIFVDKISAGGIAVMETVARDMKQMGLYQARSISYQGVEYDNLVHELTPDQVGMYDNAVEGWQVTLRDMASAIEAVMPEADAKSRQSQMNTSQYWGAHQRFFNQVLTAMQMPTVIRNMESDLKNDMAVVVQMVNTNEQATERGASRLMEGETLDDLDITPKQVLIDMVERTFPTQQMEQVVNEDGDKEWAPAYDSQGNPVINRQAAAAKESLLENLADMRLPGNPLDMILEHFGLDRVAEVTGRTTRFLRDDSGKRKRMSFGKKKRQAEAEEFQNGDRDILIFSMAGGTGSSFHADLAAKNQKRRSHYILQPGWQADQAMQGFGRTHRSNQRVPPVYKLVQTNLAGHKRFVSTIARRLDQLGALTKGQKDASSTGMFSAADNLENDYALAAVNDLFSAVRKGEGVMTESEVLNLMGIRLRGKDGSEQHIQIKSFLNRVLSLPVNLQNKVFDDFQMRLEAKIEQAKEDGTLNMGMETIPAVGAEVLQEDVIHTDPATGAETKYAQIEIERESRPTEWADLQVKRARARVIKYVRHKETGGIFQVVQAPNHVDARTGKVYAGVRLEGPTQMRYMEERKLTQDKYEDVPKAKAKTMWDDQIQNTPGTYKRKLHMVTGALLPVYDRLPVSNPKIRRIVLNNGNSYLGRVFTAKEIQEVLKKFRVKMKGEQYTSEQVIDAAMAGRTVVLSNDVRIQRTKVSGENRLSLTNIPMEERYSGGPLTKMGIQRERINNYQIVYFVPKGDAGIQALSRYLQNKEVMDVSDSLTLQQRGDFKRVQFSPSFGNIASNMQATLRDTAQAVFGKDFNVEVVKSFNDGYRGAYDVETQTAYIAMQVSNKDMTNSLWHEGLHYLRQSGALAGADWQVLAAQAKRWRKQYNIDDRYGDLSEETRVEEAVAEALADYATNRQGLNRPTKTVFDKIMRFFESLGNYLKGQGFKSASDLFDRIAAGNYAGQGTQTGQGVRFQRPAFKNADTEARWKEASKGVKPQTFGRFRETVSQEWKKLTRARQHMAKTKDNADVLEKLIHLEQSEHKAKERISGLFQTVMGGLKAEDVDLMTRKMVLDDLLWSSEQGMALPFGLKNADEVAEALEDVEAALETRPDLMQRLQKREDEREMLRNQMVETGVLTERQAQNPNYFRHQVLEYAEIRARAGTGSSKVKSSYWHPRRGSEKDINANYFQAEADWMYKAYKDLATANFLNYLRNSKYNSKKQLVSQARAHNNKALQNKLASSPEIKTKYNKKSAQIARALQGLRKFLDKDSEQRRRIRTSLPPFLRRTFDDFLEGAGKKSLLDLSESNNLFIMVRHFADSGMPDVNQLAGSVLGATYRRREYVKQILGDEWANTMDIKQLIQRFGKDNQTAWQPDSYDGKQRKVHIFTGKTVSQHVLDRAMDNIDAIVGRTITQEEAQGIKDMLSAGQTVRQMGGPMEEMVLSEELAETLNDFYDENITSLIDGWAVQLTGRWKQWTLFNPARFAKYYLNNLTGDIDALLATPAGRKIFARLPRAFREVRGMIQKGELTADLEEALDKGVIQSSLVMQEIQNMGPLMDDAFRIEKGKLPVRAVKGYFNAVQNFARLRENAFRYAAYLHFKEQTNSGKTMLEIGYGATPPWMIEGITDPNDRAARMARDIMGDYGAIPYRAKWARKRVIPFVSWIASNTTRYVNLFRNAYLYGRDVGAAKGLGMGAIAAAGLGGRIFLFYGMVNLWNNLLFGEDEEKLGTEERIRMHLNLGTWGGKVATIRFQGAMSDFAGWFGMEDAGAAIAEIHAGRASYMDLLKSIAKAPFNKIGQAVTPLIKLPLELTIGQQFFPDLFSPRSIRDRTRHAARTFTLDYPTAMAKQAMGQSAPVKTPAEQAAGVLVTFRDPGQIAYDNIRRKAFTWLRRETGATVGGRPGGKSQALYNYRLALRLGDKRSQRLAIDELKQYPGATRSLRQSLRSAAPLAMLNNKQKREFLATLSPKERNQLARAAQWWGY